MIKDYATIYQQIGRLLEVPPDLSTVHACAQSDSLRWLGRGHALVQAVEVGLDAIQFSSAVDRMRSPLYDSAVRQVFQILYRALGHCEIHLPVGSAGAFVPVGNSFDAYTAISKIFKSATVDIMIVDPYLDDWLTRKHCMTALSS